MDVKIDDLPKEKKVEEPQPSPIGEAEEVKTESGAAKPRRRRVRRADDEDFVMVQSGEGQ